MAKDKNVEAKRQIDREAQIQLDLLRYSVYEATAMAKRIFLLSTIAAIIGFAALLWGILALYFHQSQIIIIVALVSGFTAELISGFSFYQYRRNMNVVDKYTSQYNDLQKTYLTGKIFSTLSSPLSDSTTLASAISVDRLSKAEPGNVQEIAASQIQLLNVYHNVVLDQAKRSFLSALIAASVGLIFFIAAVGFLLLKGLPSASLISLSSGAIVEVISGINFYLYGKASIQMADFQVRLDMTQRYLLANSVCEGLDGEFKQRARSSLVAAIAGAGATNTNPIGEANQKLSG